MKLNKFALLEIVEIVRRGLMEGRDISQDLRELDFDYDPRDLVTNLKLSDEYLKSHPRDDRAS